MPKVWLWNSVVISTSKLKLIPVLLLMPSPNSICIRFGNSVLTGAPSQEQKNPSCISSLPSQISRSGSGSGQHRHLTLAEARESTADRRFPPILGSNVWFRSWLGFLILSHVGAPAGLLRLEILAVYTRTGMKEPSEVELAGVTPGRGDHTAPRNALGGALGFDGAAALAAPAPPRLAEAAPEPDVHPARTPQTHHSRPMQ